MKNNDASRAQKQDDPREDAQPDPTGEVGSEGGSFGNVEIGVDKATGTGSEAGETWRPTGEDRIEVVRDETGVGRRSP